MKTIEEKDNLIDTIKKKLDKERTRYEEESEKNQALQFKVTALDCEIQVSVAKIT
jgi:hypothetical protein